MYTQKNSVKRSLITSATALVLSIAMLIGTTFAWFTDSVTSGRNKIVAGNLDVELEYAKQPKDDGTTLNWQPVQDSTDLFDDEALWEPGHTDFVYLRITNKGTLALNYKLNVTPFNEIGGVNMAGDSFKLSDYLVFATTEQKDSEFTYTDRADVRAAAGSNLFSTVGQAGLAKANDTPLLKDQTAYTSLIVYMPEDVGNVANYKTGSTEVPPQIEFGVTLTATQAEHEEDSFGKDYDQDAILFPDNTNKDKLDSSFTAQIVKNASIVRDENSSETLTGITKDATNNTYTIKSDSEIVAGTPEAEAVIPATAIKDNGQKSTTTDIALSVTAANSDNPGNITIQDAQTSKALEIKVTGLVENNTAPIKVTTYIAKNLANLALHHTHEDTTTEMTSVSSEDAFNTDNQFFYDASTGKLVLYVSTFSPFTYIYDKPVNKFSGGDGTEEYPYLIATIEDLEALESFDFESNPNCFFKQTSDITPTKAIKADPISGTYDGNGHTLDLSQMPSTTISLFNNLYNSICGHLTFKNLNMLMGNTPIALIRDVDWGTTYGADFENITFNTKESGKILKTNLNNFGFVVIDPLYTGGSEGEPAYNFKNITNNVSLQNEGTCTGVFIGSGPCFEAKSNLSFDNCVNNGNITGTDYVGYLYGNPSYISDCQKSNSTITATNCQNSGTLDATLKNTGICAVAPKYEALNNAVTGSGTFKVGGAFTNLPAIPEVKISQDNATFALNGDADPSYSYKMVVNVQSIYTVKDGQDWATIENFKPSSANSYVSNGVKYISDIKPDASITGTLNSFHAYDYRSAQKKSLEESSATATDAGYSILVKDGTNNLIFHRENNIYIDSNVSIRVYAYNAEGYLAGIMAIK